ncbi:hypothetical protein F9U45_17725 [Pectobacterium versatile]|nr:hypothetical protein [Pectobacterium versatile]
MNAALDIHRRTLNDEHIVEIVIKLGVGKTVAAVMSAEDFTLAITGRSENPVKLKLRNVDVVLAGNGGKDA